MKPDLVPFEEFRDHIATQLEVEFPEDSPKVRFVEDMEFDSITMLELLVAIEDLGVDVPLDRFQDVYSLADAYDCYVSATAQAAEDGGPAAG